MTAGRFSFTAYGLRQTYASRRTGTGKPPEVIVSVLTYRSRVSAPIDMRLTAKGSVLDYGDGST